MMMTSLASSEGRIEPPRTERVGAEAGVADEQDDDQQAKGHDHHGQEQALVAVVIDAG